ncbi:Putative multicopper oxidase, second cupredoxin domain-containing protein [Colletotrichum destructivum]|uniref:Multicopper oxidase, second cupredoxin domain-containing protein n=1 Tax=Colletotrichum destructivum TaxID=34406 RepID=A0AAX4I495_9PEZI|nr:Putative multicopper oxidase, second cupredoxin domain-containing protein [Colletotrichum destructivum]
MSSGLVPRDGTTREEYDPMLGGRSSSSETDVEDRLLLPPGEEKHGGSSSNNYRRHAGHKKTFRWIMVLTCISIMMLIPFILSQFFNVQSKAQPPPEPAHDGGDNNHAGEQQQESPPPPPPSPPPPSPPPPPPTSEPVLELTTTVTPPATTSSSPLVPTQTPAVKLTPQQQFDLKTGFGISNATSLREYVFNITREQHAPDGFEKSMIKVNGQSPGPLIEANTGDTVRVTVHNHMPEESTTIHWHGIDQRNSVWMDGVSGVTQCAIPPGESFTYEFNLTDQRGTFWWHAHVSVQVTDGLFGPLIIHDPDEKVPPVDDDKILMVGDLFHEYGSTLLTQYLSANPPWAPKKPGREPPPDNIIINGMNTFNCSSVMAKGKGKDHAPGHDMGDHNSGAAMGDHNRSARDHPKCTWGSLFNTRVKSGSTARLRLINHGTSTPIYVTVDGHALEIVEIDGVEVAPIATTRVYMNPGQRYSVLVHANQTAGNYLIRADAAVRCFHMSHKTHDGMMGGMHGTPFGATAVLSYDETDVGAAPIGKAWSLDAKSTPQVGKEPWGSRCEDLPFNLPKPARSRPAYDVGERNHHYFTFRQERVGDVVRTHVNKTLYTPLRDDASLWKVLQQDISPENLDAPQPKLDFGKDQFVLVSQDAKAAQIVVNSDAMMVHPWHLQ